MVVLTHTNMKMNRILAFCKAYKERQKLAYDAEKKSTEPVTYQTMYDCAQEKDIKFTLCLKESYGMGLDIHFPYGSPVIYPDEEDLAYFYNKYSTQLDKEMNEELSKVRKRYE